MDAKVSLLIPCYNAEKFLNNFFDSIKKQKHLPYEIIAVDDGSTDSTAEILKNYKKEFENMKISFKYVFKKNGGQASACARGLLMVSGDYLIWADPDDELFDENSISCRVEYMDSHPECGILRANGYTYSEANLNLPKGRISKKYSNTTLKDFLNFKVPWCCGCYMIRMSALEKVNPEREIFDSTCGQNIQMLLPVISKFPCHYLNKNVYKYIIYNNSHSHRKLSYYDAVKRIDKLSECVIETLKIANADTKDNICTNASCMRNLYFDTAWHYDNRNDMRKYEVEMRQNNEFFLDLKLKYYIPYKSKISKIIVFLSIFRKNCLKL